MTTSPQEPAGPVRDPDLDPRETAPAPDPDTLRPDVQPSPAGGEPLTADPGEPSAPLT